jgi:hypothetical protein
LPFPQDHSPLAHSEDRRDVDDPEPQVHPTLPDVVA